MWLRVLCVVVVSARDHNVRIRIGAPPVVTLSRPHVPEHLYGADPEAVAEVQQRERGSRIVHGLLLLRSTIDDTV